MKNSCIILSFIIFLFFCPDVHAKIYIWTDEKGVKHYSNIHPTVNINMNNLRTKDEILYSPPLSEKKIGEEPEIKLEKKQPVYINKEKEGEEEEGEEEQEEAEIVQNREVIMYSAKWCGVCKRAKRFFSKHDISYTEVDIEKSKKGLREFKMLGGRGVPLVKIGTFIIKGFDEYKIKKALSMN